MTVKLILIFVVIIPKQSSHYVCLLLTVLDSVCQINKTMTEMYIWKNVNTREKKKKIRWLKTKKILLPTMMIMMTLKKNLSNL